MMLKINQRFYYDGIWINKIHKKFFVIIVDILMANIFECMCVCSLLKIKNEYF